MAFMCRSPTDEISNARSTSALKLRGLRRHAKPELLHTLASDQRPEMKGIKTGIPAMAGIPYLVEQDLEVKVVELR